MAQETERGKHDDYARALYFQEADFQVVDRVIQVAARRGAKPAHVAMAWLLRQYGVAAPIFGATKAEYIDDAIASLGLTLDGEECKMLEEAYIPHKVLGISEFRR